MRLLLDEMISPRIAHELRKKGHDVQAVKRDRPELAGRSDQEIVQKMAEEQRTIVTNDILDFQAIHDRTLASGGHHGGLIFTFDDALPRSKAAIPQWVDSLASLLEEHRDDGSLRNRVLHLI